VARGREVVVTARACVLKLARTNVVGATARTMWLLLLGVLRVVAVLGGELAVAWLRLKTPGPKVSSTTAGDGGRPFPVGFGAAEARIVVFVAIVVVRVGLLVVALGTNGANPRFIAADIEGIADVGNPVDVEYVKRVV